MSGCRDLTAQGLSLPRTGSHRNAGRPRQHVRLGSIRGGAGHVYRLCLSLPLFRRRQHESEACLLLVASKVPRRHHVNASGLDLTVNLVSSHINLELTLVCSDMSLRHQPHLAMMVIMLTSSTLPRPSLNEDLVQRCIELEQRGLHISDTARYARKPLLSTRYTVNLTLRVLFLAYPSLVFYD
ncbi:hypothetical protein BDZ89DRAFT_1061172 [Hymenopellis radicata]|nr:hypothetical protein BDZ89DRAFT_1061172 [Hymenopellis radicata]